MTCTTAPRTTIALDARTGPAELLEAAIVGDQRAWELLHHRFNPLIRSVIAGFRLDDDAVSDVAQNVWLRLHLHGHRVRDGRRLASWLATTARNEALRHIERNRRHRPVADLGDQADRTSPSPDERADDAETVAEALGAVAGLPENSQQLLRLLVAQPPMSYVEIAHRLGRPVGSIGPSRSRCLATLQSRLSASAA